MIFVGLSEPYIHKSSSERVSKGTEQEGGRRGGGVVEQTGCQFWVPYLSAMEVDK